MFCVFMLDDKVRFLYFFYTSIFYCCSLTYITLYWGLYKLQGYEAFEET